MLCVYFIDISKVNDRSKKMEKSNLESRNKLNDSEGDHEDLEEGELSEGSQSMDYTAEQIRSERKLRRKLKKERKKAERKAAALINGKSSKKKKKRKHSDVDSKEDACASPQKKAKHESNKDASPETEEQIRSPRILTEEEVQILKEEKKKRIQRIMQLPKLFLTLREIFGRSVEKEGAVVPPLEVKNIQNLILYSLMGMKASVMPRWCRLLRWTKITSVVLVVLDGVTQQHSEDTHICKNISRLFDMSVPIKPVKKNLEYDLLNVPVTKTKFKKTKDKDRLKHIKEVPDDGDTGKNTDASEGESSSEDSENKDGGFKPDRRGYLLTQEQMQTHGYPTEDDKGYISTKYSEIVHKTSPMFSIDCEMCLTKEGHELTRISVVDENLDVLYDTLVKPPNPIINHLTQYSGITKEMLQPIKTRLSDVQEKLFEILPPDAILIGQSLESDLQALKIYHPHIIDTSILFLGHNQHKIGLRNLAAAYLKEFIQTGNDGHDSVEDAIAAMKLAQLKIEKGPAMQSYHELLAKKKVESFFSTIQNEGIEGSMLDTLSNVRLFKNDPVNSIPCLNDKETLRKLPGALHLGKFVWVQFHSLSTILQGISQDKKTISDTLHRLDKRVKHVYDALPMKSLYLVLATGNKDCQEVRDNEDDTSRLGRCYMTLKLPLITRTDGLQSS
ncbi:RNA exonuclease 5-like [Glandiceps talaboti]